MSDTVNEKIEEEEEPKKQLAEWTEPYCTGDCTVFCALCDCCDCLVCREGDDICEVCELCTTCKEESEKDDCSVCDLPADERIQ